MTEQTQSAPAPKRRRRFGWLIALAVVILLLVIGVVVGDAVARQYAQNLVRDRIVQVLGLPQDAQVGVDLGGGSVLLQAATGSFDRVSVEVPQLSFDELSASATLTATGVPLDTAKPVTTLDAVVTVDQENVSTLAGFLSGVGLSSITLENGLIRAGADLTALGATVPVAVDLQPAARDGGLSFTPVTILLGGQAISVADLRANPLFGALAGQLLSSRDFCVANFLPQALTLDTVEVVGTDLLISLDADGTALSDPALSTRGSCP